MVDLALLKSIREKYRKPLQITTGRDWHRMRDAIPVLLDYIDEIETELHDLRRIVHDALLDDPLKEALFQRGKNSTIPLLEKLEWSAEEIDDDRSYVASCCPLCRGLRPGVTEEEEAEQVDRHGFGSLYHAPACELAEVLGRETRDLNAEEPSS